MCIILTLIFEYFRRMQCANIIHFVSSSVSLINVFIQYYTTNIILRINVNDITYKIYY